ncbi:glycosyltransferase [Plantactinospora siamensis]|uniref:Glycosyltransferase n=1 Tax=Plantactinospora siamensis TaxID=555372 RepID=A0ABV6P511_9ACTN
MSGPPLTSRRPRGGGVGTVEPAGPATPLVSVLLVSWNTREKTRRCLESLAAAATGATRYELIVVDNGSTDGSAQLLAERADVRLLRNPGNRGFAAAVNQAYREAQGDLILLLNSDVECRPGALTALVDFLADRPEVAGVAPHYVDEDGEPDNQYLGMLGFRAAVGLAVGLRSMPGLRGAWRRYQLRDVDFGAARPVPQPPASCLLLRRGVLPPDHIFDEGYPLYFNDVRLAQQLSTAGRPLWSTPDAVVVHNPGTSGRMLPAATRSRHHLGGLVRFVSQTQPRRRLWLLRLLVLLSRPLRAVVRAPGRLGPRDLLAAVRGDCGALPDDLRPWLVMFSGVAWRTEAHRQHALARELAADRRVLFVEPPGNRPRWRFRVTPIEPSLWRVTPPAVLPGGRQLPPANWVNRWLAARLIRRWLDRHAGQRLAWIDDDLSLAAARRLRADSIVYDCTDLSWTFARPWNRWHLRRGARRAVRAADLVLASSPALLDRLPSATAPVVLVPNACDPERFSRSGPVAEWTAELPRPLLGYAGAVDTRAFDAGLVATVARLRPDWTFLLVGPQTAAGRAALTGLPNVVLRGMVEFADVPAILRACDVLLIPYRVGELIDYVQPKKLYEYLALGKPVVATPLPALRHLDEPIHLAAGAAAFAAAIDEALREENADAAAARRAAAERNTWSRRADRVRELFDECAARRGDRR